MEGFFEFLSTGWMHAAPIMVAAVVALAIFFERWRALYYVYPIKNSDAFYKEIRELVIQDRVSEAVSLCDRYPTKPVASVVKTGLLRAHQPETLIENGLELEVEEATQKLQRRTTFLATIANVATLLGLLGTIAGLIASFQSIGEEGGQKAALLAKGISVAMHATMLGLGVAIPSMIAFSVLMNRTNRLISEVETSAAKILDIFRQRYFDAEKVISGRRGPDKRGVA